ncbi:MAG: hypothetical protein HY313_00265 [Acidobacteria bacterium]|nr:hypothetical protein [Acidobacteriota bacterium]
MCAGGKKAPLLGLSRRHYVVRMSEQQTPTVSPLIQSLLPDATVEEQLEAQQNFREFLAVAYRMHLRLQAEKEASRDKKTEGDTVNDAPTV